MYFTVNLTYETDDWSLNPGIKQTATNARFKCFVHLQVLASTKVHFCHAVLDFVHFCVNPPVIFYWFWLFIFSLIWFGLFAMSCLSVCGT